MPPIATTRTPSVRPTALELCNRTDDDCSGAPDDGARMECALGELVECTTECGITGTAECTPECRVSVRVLAADRGL